MSTVILHGGPRDGQVFYGIELIGKELRWPPGDTEGGKYTLSASWGLPDARSEQGVYHFEWKADLAPDGSGADGEQDG